MGKTKTKLKKNIVKKLRPGIEPRTGVYVHPAHQASTTTPTKVLVQCTESLHPGWGQAVLVGCPPLTQKMDVSPSPLAQTCQASPRC